MPYDPDYPVVCMDESCKQLIGEVRKPMPCVPGKPERMDDEYVRNGVVDIFMEVEPLAGKRHVAITEHRTRKDCAMHIKQMLEERYPSALKVHLVMDNLNTHTIVSLYETFKPGEARRLAERLNIHYTPKHGSWLNMAEIELSVLKGQCLNRRIPDITTMRHKVAAWEKDRNNSAKKIVGNLPLLMLGLLLPQLNISILLCGISNLRMFEIAVDVCGSLQEGSHE